MVSGQRTPDRKGPSEKGKKALLETIEDKATEENAVRTTDSKRQAASSGKQEEPALSEKSYSTKEVSGQHSKQKECEGFKVSQQQTQPAKVEFKPVQATNSAMAPAPQAMNNAAAVKTANPFLSTSQSSKPNPFMAGAQQ